jgi:hypothetical protein
MNLAQAEQFRKDMEAAGHPSDGCTMAPEIGTPCCQMHDYLRRFRPDGITRKEADKLFLRCMQNKTNYFIAYIYYLGVRIGGLFYK